MIFERGDDAVNHCCDARGMPKVLMRDEPDFVDRPTCGFRPYLHEAVVFSQMDRKLTDAEAGLYRGTQHEAGIEGRYDAPRVYRFASKSR